MLLVNFESSNSLWYLEMVRLSMIEAESLTLAEWGKEYA